jgi:hypothetical protein
MLRISVEEQPSMLAFAAVFTALEATFATTAMSATDLNYDYAPARHYYPNPFRGSVLWTTGPFL